jgi:hypothetical protein
MLIPLLVRKHTSWENDLLYFERILPLQSIVRQKAEEEKTEISLYINREISFAFSEFEPELSEGYYLYSEFSSISRINYTARVNLPEDLILLIEFFK